MPLISEEDYFLFADGILNPNANEEDKKRFAQLMQDFETQQRNLGFPEDNLTPKRNARKTALQEAQELKTQQLFAGLDQIKMPVPSNIVTTPDARATYAVSKFFESTYQDYDPDKFSSFRADFITKRYTSQGNPAPASDVELYNNLKSEYDATQAAKRKQQANFNYALEAISKGEYGDDAIKRLRNVETTVPVAPAPTGAVEAMRALGEPGAPPPIGAVTKTTTGEAADFDQQQFITYYNALQKKTENFGPAVDSYIASAVRKQREPDKFTDADQRNLDNMVTTLNELPPNERSLLLMHLRGKASKIGRELAFKENWWGEELAGGFTRIYSEGWKGLNLAETERMFSLVPTQGSVETSIPEIKSMEDAKAYIDEQNTKYADKVTRGRAGPEVAAGMALSDIVFGQEVPTRQLTADESIYIQQALKKERKSIDTARQVDRVSSSLDVARDIQDGFTWTGAIGLGADTLGSSAAIIGPMFAGAAGAIVPLYMYYGMEYNQLSDEYPDMTPEQKMQVSAFTSGFQTILDFANVGFIKKVPEIAALARKTDGSMFKKLMFGLGYGTIGYGFENLIEGGQDASTPLTMMLFRAIDDSFPEIDVEKELGEWISTRPDVAIGMIPLTLLMGGGGAAYSYFNEKAYLTSAANEELLKDMGIIAEDRATLMRLAKEKKSMEIAELMPEIKTRIDTKLRAARAAEKFMTGIRGSEGALVLNSAIEAGVIPDFQMTKDGAFEVQDPTAQGGRIRFNTRQEAVDYLQTKIIDNSRRIAAVARGEVSAAEESAAVDTNPETMARRNDATSKLKGMTEAEISEANAAFGDPVKQKAIFDKLVTDLASGRLTPTQAIDEYIGSVYAILPKSTKFALGTTRSTRKAVLRSIIKNLAGAPIRAEGEQRQFMIRQAPAGGIKSVLGGAMWSRTGIEKTNLSEPQKKALRWLQGKLTEKGVEIVVASPELGGRVTPEQQQEFEQIQQSTAALSDIFGVAIQFFDTKDGSPVEAAGFFDPESMTIFVNARQTGNDPFAYIMGHEFSHFLKRLDPTLFGRISNIILGSLKDTAVVDLFARDSLPEDTYFTARGMNKSHWFSFSASARTQGLLNMGYTQETIDLVQRNINEEFIGDYVGREFVNGKLWNEVYKQDKTLFSQLAESFMRYIGIIKDKIMRMMGNQDINEQISNDVEAVRLNLAKVIKEYADLTTDVSFAKQWYSYYGKNISAFFLANGFRAQIQQDVQRIYEQGETTATGQRFYRVAVKNGKVYKVPRFVPTARNVTASVLTPEQQAFQVIKSILAFSSPNFINIGSNIGMTNFEAKIEMDKLSISLADPTAPIISVELPDGNTVEVPVSPYSTIKQDIYDLLMKHMGLTEDDLLMIRKQFMKNLPPPSKQALGDLEDNDPKLMVRNGNVTIDKDVSLGGALRTAVQTMTISDVAPELVKNIPLRLGALQASDKKYAFTNNKNWVRVSVDYVAEFSNDLNVDRLTNSVPYLVYFIENMYNYKRDTKWFGKKLSNLRALSLAELQAEAARLENVAFTNNILDQTDVSNFKNQYVKRIKQQLNLNDDQAKVIADLSVEQITRLQYLQEELDAKTSLIKRGVQALFGDVIGKRDIAYLAIPNLETTDGTTAVNENLLWVKVIKDVLNVNILFTDNLFTPAASSSYHRGTTYIGHLDNPLMVFGHEYTHNIEDVNPNLYKDLQEIVFNVITTPEQREEFYRQLSVIYFTDAETADNMHTKSLFGGVRRKAYEKARKDKEDFLKLTPEQRMTDPRFTQKGYAGKPIWQNPGDEFLSDFVGRRFLDKDFFMSLVAKSPKSSQQYLEFVQRSFDSVRLSALKRTKEALDYYIAGKFDQDIVIEALYQDLNSQSNLAFTSIDGLIELHNQMVSMGQTKAPTAGATSFSFRNGAMGPVITGKTLKESLDELIKNKTGVAENVLTHPDIPEPISIIYGYSGATKSESTGLAKILAWHKEVDVYKLQDMLNQAVITNDEINRSYVLVTPEGVYGPHGSKIVIKKVFNNTPGNWLLTAFEIDPNYQEQDQTNDLPGVSPVKKAPLPPIVGRRSAESYSNEVNHVAGRIRGIVAAAQVAATQARARAQATGTTVEQAAEQIALEVSPPVDEASFDASAKARAIIQTSKVTINFDEQGNYTPQDQQMFDEWGRRIYSSIKSLKDAISKGDVSMNALATAAGVLNGKYADVVNLTDAQKQDYILKALNKADKELKKMFTNFIENGLIKQLRNAAAEAKQDNNADMERIYNEIADAFEMTDGAEQATTLFNSLYTSTGVPIAASGEEFYNNLLKYNIIKIVGNWRNMGGQALDEMQKQLNQVLRQREASPFIKNIQNTIYAARQEAATSTSLADREKKLFDKLNGQTNPVWRGAKKIFQPLTDFLKSYTDSHLTFASLIELVFPNNNRGTADTYKKIKKQMAILEDPAASEEAKFAARYELNRLKEGLGKAIIPEMQKVVDDILNAYTSIQMQHQENEDALRQIIGKIYALKKPTAINVNKILAALVDRTVAPGRGFEITVDGKTYVVSQAYAGYLLNLYESQMYNSQLQSNGITLDVISEIRSKISKEADELRKEYRKMINQEFIRANEESLRTTGVGTLIPSDMYFPVQYKSAFTALIDAFDINFQGGIVDKDNEQVMQSEGRDIELDLETQAINMASMFNSFMYRSMHKRNVQGPVATAKAVLLDSEIAKRIKNSFGNDFYELLYRQLSAIETNGIRTTELSRVWRRYMSGLMSGAAQGSLAANPSTILLNALSFFNTGLDPSIPWNQALRSYVKVLLNIPVETLTGGAYGIIPKSPAELRQHEFIQQRIQSGANSLIALSKNDPNVNKPNALTQAGEWGMRLISIADAFAGSYAAAASYDAHYTLAKKAGMTDEQAAAAADAGVKRTIQSTFQPNTVAMKAPVEVGQNLVMRVMGMFMSEARKAIGLEITAAKRHGLASKEFMRVVFINHIVLGSLAFFIRGTIRDLLNDDEDDEEIWNPAALMQQMIAGPLAGIFIMGTVAETALSKMTNLFIEGLELTDEEVVPGMAAVKKLPIFPRDNILASLGKQLMSVEKLAEEDITVDEQLDAIINAGKAAGAILNNASISGAVTILKTAKAMVDLADEQSPVDFMEEPE